MHQNCNADNLFDDFSPFDDFESIVTTLTMSNVFEVA